MKVAILGFGEMGRMLAELIAAGGQAELAIANRTPGRMADFAAAHPEVTMAPSFSEACRGADIIFLCVLPLAARETLDTALPVMKSDAHLVSIISDLPLPCIEALFPGRASRLVPTATSAAGRGITLMARGSRVTDADAQALAGIFGGALSFRVVPDLHISVLSGLTSCGPGLLAAIFDEMEASFCRTCGLDRALVHPLLAETVAGTCELASVLGASFAHIYGRVATTGGITESGASALREALPVAFDMMNARMAARHAEREDRIMRGFPAVQDASWPSEEWKDWNTM